MAIDTTAAAAKAEQREVEAFLADPANHQQVKQSWRPYVQAKLGFRPCSATTSRVTSRSQ